MKKYDPVKRLEARANLDARKMLEMLGKNAVRVKGLIIGAKDVQQARGREALFREVAAAFHALGGNMDGLLKDCAAETAMASAKAVGQSLIDKAKEAGNSILKFSLERAKRYWRYVCPENSRGLAATSTDKMGADLIDTLRRAVVEVERQAAIEGWTMDEIRKAIEDKWAEISKNDKNFKFVDKSGRAWENGRYCQMLARTTATRVWNDSYLDRLAEEGFQFVKVSQHGSEPDCDVCRAWAGKICVIAGKSDKYPTVEDARAAGVFHPNCMCTWEYVDEDEDKAELEKQALKAGEKVDWNDPKAVEKKNRPEIAAEKAKQEEAKRKAEERERIELEGRVAKAELRAMFPADFPDEEKHVFDGIPPEVAIKYAEAVKGVVRSQKDYSFESNGILNIAQNNWSRSKTTYFHEAGHAVFGKHDYDSKEGEGFTVTDWSTLHVNLTPSGRKILTALTEDTEKFFDDNGGTRKRKVEEVRVGRRKEYQIVEGDRDWEGFSLDTVTQKIFGAGKQYYRLSEEDQHLAGCVTDIFQAVTDSAFKKGAGHDAEYFRHSMYGDSLRLNESFANLSALLAQQGDEHARNALAIFPKAAKMIGEFYGIKND